MLIPPVSFAHPLEGDRAVAVSASVSYTAEGLGEDGDRYRRLFGPLVRDMDGLVPALLAPSQAPPRHLLAMARFALPGLLPATWLARQFRTGAARALLAGAAAHSVLPLSTPLTASFGLLFVALGHAYGWPVVEGGSDRLVDALLSELRSLGGELTTGRWVKRLGELSGARVVLLDVSARQLPELLGPGASPDFIRALSGYRYGPGVCKVDWALSSPVPWRAPACHQAVTLHVGGSFEEIAASEADVAAGRHPERPFCIVAQPGVVDSTRAPGGNQTLWAYCHVPSGSTVDMTQRIEAQVERFAPGFRDLVMARSTKTAADMEHSEPQLRRRGHRRRPVHAAPDLFPAHGPMGQLQDRSAWRLPLLGIGTSRRGRARHVRLLGGPPGTEGPDRKT